MKKRGKKARSRAVARGRLTMSGNAITPQGWKEQRMELGAERGRECDERKKRGN